MKKNPFSLFRPAISLAFSILLLATSCDPKKDTPVPTVITTSGVYVVNEGTSSGAISFFDKATKAIQPDLYAAGNSGKKLGPVVENMTIVGTNAYLVVNEADSVQVVKLSDFKRTASISGLSQPRYLVASSTAKAYLSEWQGPYPNYVAGKVAVLNLATNTVTKEIAVGVNPEQLLLIDSHLYVTNSNGNSITVINTTTDAVESTIAVPDGPKNILRDTNGNVWVLCNKYGGTQDYLVRFAPATPTQQTRIAIAHNDGNSNLRTNGAGDQIYVSLGTGTYQLSPTATALPATPLIRRNFYGLGIDPQDNTIYGGTATFTGNAQMIRYTATGTVIDSFTVGLGPNAFLFR